MTANDDLHRRVKVIKLIWWIPHYRVSVFRRLCQNPRLDFTVCAGDNTRVFAGAKVASASEVGDIEGVRWRRLKSHRIASRPFRDYEWQPEAVKIAWREDFDALICLGNKSLSNWLARAICRLRGIPVIEWSQGIKGPEGGLKWAFRKFYFKWAKACLLYGGFARDFFATHGFDAQDLFVVHNSLDHDKQVAIRNRFTPGDLRRTRGEFGAGGPDDRLIFCSGRLEKAKSLYVLIDAIAGLKNRNRQVAAVLIGDGREEQALRSLARDRGVLDRVVFFGACYDENVLGRIISAADLCVVPRAAGLIVMHALVYGTPILTCENTAWSHGPEVEAVIEGETGGYFRDGDLDDLIGKMETMLYPVSCKVSMRDACMKMIDTGYTPEYQERVIIQALNHVLPAEKQIPLPD